MLNYENPDLPPPVALDATERKLIARYGKGSDPPRTLGDCIVRVA